jgi:hypothetical protein
MDRIKIFCRFGKLLRAETAGVSREFASVMRKAENKFPFFTRSNIIRSLNSCAAWLTEDNLTRWFYSYPSLCGDFSDKRVAVVMAGNIPFVGFHDILCVLMAGYRTVLKPSSNDSYLPQYLLKVLREASPEMAARIEITDDVLMSFDAVIATGSNNSARYFEEYFASVPHLIRRNRSSVAVLCGQESEEDLNGLHDDIFSYFGLGCRNISHVFLPDGYDVRHLALHAGSGSSSSSILKAHSAYFHNYKYARAMALMNGAAHIDTGFSLWVEDITLSAPVAVINYSFYNNLQQVEQCLFEHKDEIQCIAAGSFQSPFPCRDNALSALPIVPLGSTQSPSITDYADGVDTMLFLSQI